MSIIQGTSKSSAAEYSIDQSIRFNADDSTFLTRTPGSEGNRRTFTLSTWVKFNEIRSDNIVFASWISSGASSYALMYMHSDFRVRFEDQGTSKIKPSMVFRDTAAWYHIVLRVDTTDSTANDRYQMYINGERQTDLHENDQPSQDHQTNVNKTQPHYLGRNGYSLAMIYSDLYQAETHFIDGTALDCNSFGEFDSNTGQWIPKPYTGSYGTQGFYIKGEDSSDLGNDSSGNGNDFSSSGLTTADQVNDSPTSNHCTLNFLNKDTDCTLTDGNLQVGWTSGTDPIICGTMAVSSGKWYYEATFTGTFNFPAVGIAPAELSFGGSAFSSGNGALFYYAPSGNYRGNGDNVSYGAEYFVSSKIGVALNLDDNEITFFKDNSSQGTLNLASIRSGYSTWVPLVTGGGSVENIIVNFGQTAFNYTPPTGFKAWSVDNMVDPSIADPSAHFQTTLYTGNGSTQSINQSGNSTFQPDWVWIKNRTTAGNEHDLYDVLRGATKAILSSSAQAQFTTSSGLTAFESDGFAVGNRGEVNTNGDNIVAWQWKANGAGSSNSNGSITSTVSANQTAGFSVGTYTGNGTDNATVGHGLGGADMVWVKRLNTTGNWRVYEKSTNLDFFLDLTNAGTSPTEIKSTSSTTFTLGSGNGFNGSSDSHVFYAFQSIDGFSKISSYTGNSSTDGTFVHTGFKPALIILKRTNATQEWQIYDNQRDPFNVAKHKLEPNSNGAESVLTSDNNLDFLSNGFKLRQGNGGMNASGSSYIYMAIAETPFKTANAR